ncbi:O-antigen ligase family protein [Pedobacter sp. BS3]|uniref:O-antigen ligase family protein n=1 Tax=Pedobacter sp. BS3 TaxID=2567937 RepID=UPI0011EDCAD1|nr:O-antigen ligase family protein [Pedobacter sp. BS3]TZF84991.1 O-antigen ligase family protein [Pedobacter sp. BS3]
MGSFSNRVIHSDKRVYLVLGIIGIIVSLCFAFLIKELGLAGGAIPLALMIGIPVLYGVIAYPRFGIIILIISAFLLMWVYKFGWVEFPLGTLMDGLQALLIIGFLIKQKYHSNWRIFRNPISYMILIWISYNLLEFFNPWAESRLAWVYTIRSVAAIMLMYFIFTYSITSVKFIRTIIIVWLSLCVFAALYAIRQEYWGLFPFEQRIVDADPLLQSLLFIDGHLRKFSIFADPVSFSYNMVVASALCLALVWGPTSVFKKIVLLLMAALFLTTMFYAGTRAAYVLLPSALIFFAILNLNRKILIYAGIAAVVITFFVFVPTSNPTLYRFQSAFRPSADASYNVRQINQKRMQPYIRSHPFGGGLGATGAWGVRFAPYSFLAQFPPDSGYMRVAAELGWIGLILLCTLIFIVLKTGIENFFEIKDPELKAYCLAMLLIVFIFHFGNFPQEAFVQYPSNVLFYLSIALINVTRRLDIEKQKKLAPPPIITVP